MLTAEEMQEMVDSVKRIETCLIGDEAMGQDGLVKSNKDHSIRIKRLEHIVLYIVGAAGGIVVIYHIAMDLWSRVK